MEYNVGTNTEEKGIFDDIQEADYRPLADKGKRLANYLLDIIFAIIFAFVIIFGFMLLVALLMPSSYESFEDFSTPLAYLGIYLYYAIFEGANKGRTLGKLITGTQAIREDGANLTFQDAALRSLCRLVPFEAFSGLGDAPWHDAWTKTKVVNK